MEYKWVALTVTTVGTFMSALNGSLLTIGLPTVLSDLNTSIVHGIWIITGFRLMTTVLLVTLGRIADMYGRVKLYNFGFVVFTVGSLFCGVSQNGEELVLSRLFQGFGAAFLTVNSAAIVTDSFPRGELGMGLGINMMATNLGSIAGYSLSGIIIDQFGWRTMFLINIPVGIFGTLWSYKRLREVSTRRQGEKFDYAGSALYCAGLTLILYALTIGSLFSLDTLALLSLGLALFVVFIFVERRQTYPTLDLSLFKIRLFAASNISSFMNNLAYNCAPFLISLYLQLVKAYPPSEAGLMLIPMNVIIFIIAPISGRLSDRYGSRGLCSLGLVMNAAAMFWFSTINQDAPYTAILVSLVLFGFGRSLFTSPNTSSIMASVPTERRGIANGVRAALNQTGSVLSIPLSMIFMTAIMPYDRLSTLVSGSQLVSSGELSIFLGAINFAFLVLGVIDALAIIPSLLRGPRVNKEEKTVDGSSLK